MIHHKRITTPPDTHHNDECPECGITHNPNLTWQHATTCSHNPQPPPPTRWHLC